MGDHPHAEMYRSVHEAFASGDPTAMLDALADDVIWHQIGAETLFGKQAVAEAWEGIGSDDVDFSVEVHDVLGNDDHVVGLIQATIGVGDESFTYRTAEIAHVNAAGKVTERWAFSDDTKAITDFFANFG